MGKNSRSHIDEVLLRYLAEKIMEDLRSGNQLDEGICDALIRYPEIDYLRKAVRSDDTDCIISLCRSQKKGQRPLGFALLQPIVGNEKAQEFLKQLWDDANDYDTKRQLLWRLLDNPGLSIDIHKAIYSFVNDHWARFVADSKKWVKSDILRYVQDRLSDKSFPESKAWLYLCLASTSSNTDGIDALLNRYQDSDASIVAMVVKDLREGKT